MSTFLINKKLSHFGDLNPAYAGSVVKALASAKDGVQSILDSLEQPKGCDVNLLSQAMDAKVVDVIKLTPDIVELVIHAPLAAQNFEPGQFYKLQTFETYHGVHSIEPLALTGAQVDKEKGLIHLIVLKMGVSTDLCFRLKKDDPVVLMGPTGEPTELKGRKVILVGGGLGNAVLFSIGQAYRQKGAEILYFAAYKTRSSIFKEEEIKKAADKVIWVCEEDGLTFKGNVVEALIEYQDILKDYDHMIVIGSDKMMAAVANLRFNTLKNAFKTSSLAIGSINSPMQCMMKGICGQCIQLHRDPKTGKEALIFTCKTQDQDLSSVDFKCLHDRLSQNSLMEKLNRAVLTNS